MKTLVIAGIMMATLGGCTTPNFIFDNSDVPLAFQWTAKAWYERAADTGSAVVVAEHSGRGLVRNNVVCMSLEWTAPNDIRVVRASVFVITQPDDLHGVWLRREIPATDCSVESRDGAIRIRISSMTDPFPRSADLKTSAYLGCDVVARRDDEAVIRTLRINALRGQT